jgi:hypothetical protein
MERSYSNRSYESAQDYDDYEFRERDRLHSRGQEVDDRSFPAGSASMSHSDLPQSPGKKPAATSAAASASAVARSGTYWVNGNGNGNGHDEPVEEATPQEEKPDPTPRAMRFSDNLTGSEDVWEEPLKRYQLKREKEAAEIEAWDPATVSAECFVHVPNGGLCRLSQFCSLTTQRPPQVVRDLARASLPLRLSKSMVNPRPTRR